ncbi:MAG TPA: hypothetical protein PKV66_04595 [Candidatus Pelethenecus sp.]|nr:hypothetical protein [Candidatus Pelethenecus sp.]
MSKITLDISGRKGLIQFPSQSVRNSYLGEDGLVVDGVYNPFIRYGYLSPSTASVTNVTLDNTQNSAFKASVYDGINDDFYFYEDGSLYKGDTTSDTSLTRVVQTPNTNADGARDLEIYQVNGVRKLFGVYQANAGNAEIFISSLPYDTATDNLTWLTATVSGAFSNTLSGDAWLQVSDNGFMYFFMENQVYKIDGTAATGGANGTISSALLFPVGYKVVDSLDFRGKLLIAFHSYNTSTRDNNPSFTPSGKSTAGIYVWDRSTAISSSTDYIPVPGINIIHKLFITQSGKIRLIGTDTSGYTSLMEYNGATFEYIKRIGYNAHPLYRDSMGDFAGMSTWFGKDGILYMYGSISPGEKEGLYKLYSISLQSTSGGIILTSNGTSSTAPAIYLTYQASGGTLTNSRLKIFTLSSQIGSDTMGGGTITFPVKFLPKLSTVNFIRIFGAPAATTGSTTIATINIYLNQSSSVWAAKTVSLDIWSRGYIDIPINKPYVNSIQLEITFGAGIAGGASDFAPAYAEIDFTATETNK